MNLNLNICSKCQYFHIDINDTEKFVFSMFCLAVSGTLVPNYLGYFYVEELKDLDKLKLKRKFEMPLTCRYILEHTVSTDEEKEDKNDLIQYLKQKCINKEKKNEA